VPEPLAVMLGSLRLGGGERVGLLLAEAFAARGHRVDLLVAECEGQYVDQVPKAVRLIPLAASSQLTGRRLEFAADPGGWPILVPLQLGMHPHRLSKRLPALIHYLQTERPHALVSVGTQANMAALRAARVSGAATRIVVREGNPLSFRRRYRWAYPIVVRRLFRQAHAIIAVSDGVANDLAATAGIPRERILTIYGPVSLSAAAAGARVRPLHPWFAPGQAPVLLAVGRLVPQKGYPTLLRAFARLRSVEQVRLVILGEGWRRRSLERLVRRLGIADAVQMPGYVDNPYAYMRHSAAMVLSSAWEGIGNVLIEALACGCPVISTDCPGGPAEVLGHGAYGKLVAVGDIDALAKAMAEILAEKPDRERLRARAQEFSIDHIADSYLAVLAGSGKPPAGE
jgi:glycosyltransferase involved in cell wall biosynthesis